MSTDNANSVYIELLKASEKYCEKEDLTVFEDFVTLFDICATNYVDDYTCDGINDRDLELMIRTLKKSAYYEVMLDEETGEIVHYAFTYCFDESRVTGVLILKIYDQARKGVVYPLSDDEFNDYFKNVTVERLKNFKYLQNNQEETENV